MGSIYIIFDLATDPLAFFSLTAHTAKMSKTTKTGMLFKCNKCVFLHVTTAGQSYAKSNTFRITAQMTEIFTGTEYAKKITDVSSDTKLYPEYPQKLTNNNNKSVILTTDKV